VKNNNRAKNKRKEKTPANTKQRILFCKRKYKYTPAGSPAETERIREITPENSKTCLYFFLLKIRIPPGLFQFYYFLTVLSLNKYNIEIYS
jgi:hypothetical protein